MSYISWHNYGYGFCTDDISEHNIARLKKLLELAPEFKAQIENWLTDHGIMKPTWDDYMDFDQEYSLGLAAFLKEVIQESEGIRLVACDSEEHAKYLIYAPSYPWDIPDAERSLTEERLQEIFNRYIRILTDTPVSIDDQEIENGG